MDAETCRKLVEPMDAIAEFRKAAVELYECVLNSQQNVGTTMKFKAKRLKELESKL